MPDQRIVAATRLFCLKGSVSGVELSLPLVRGANSIGSDLASQVILDEEGVSRLHAVLVVEPGRVVIVDQNSKNGTFINARRVRRAEVAVGDEVGFGPVKLRLGEIDVDDTRLAIELPTVPRRQAREKPRDESTAVAALPRDERVHRWLRLAEGFLELLGTAGETGTAPALALIARELTAEGACLLDVEGPEPTITAAYGEIDPSVLEGLVDLKSRRRLRSDGEAPRWVFASRATVTGVLSSPDDNSSALLVFGDFADREKSESLLGLLLGIYLQLRPGRRERSVSEIEPPELRFPSNYVPGVSTAMARVHDQMRPLVPSELPVLIVGETGVGKELLARALHLSWQHRSAPFVAINCAAIPSELLEAELFGIGDRVATGVAGRRGVFQQAAGGTLFLDEVAEMPAGLQAKLLRVLQEKQIRPLGEMPVVIDVRIVAATNADLKALVESGEFRRDLFFRIAGFVLRVPPLRERREDIPVLVEDFLRRFSDDLAKPVRGLTVRALRSFVNNDWPGNVRELEHEVRRLVHLCPPEQAIESSMLDGSPLADVSRCSGAPTRPEPGADDPARRQSRPHVESAATDGDVWATAVSCQNDLDLSRLEQEVIREALRRTRGNQVQASRLLGISRHGLRRRIDRHGLRDWFVNAPDP